SSAVKPVMTWSACSVARSCCDCGSRSRAAGPTTSAPCAASGSTTDMAGRNESLQAWLLHSRPFRETSLLLEFLTLEHGRVTAIALGARSIKGRLRLLLQPFVLLRISVTGKHELRNLQASEASAPGLLLQGERLFAGLYLNELLVRLLQGHEAEP